MINEHDIKDWWLTDRLKTLQEEIKNIKSSEPPYVDLYVGLDFLNLELSALIKDAYDRLGHK